MTNGAPTASPTGDDVPPEVAKLRSDLQAAELRAEEYLNGWKRAKADYLNLKRESDEQRWLLARQAVLSVVHSLWVDFYGPLLPVFHQLPREQRQQPWLQGMTNGLKQFEAVLRKLGFTSFSPTVGQPFNPAEQEAVASVPGEPSNSVVEVVRPGLRSADDDAVVVPAQVKVAK